MPNEAPRRPTEGAELATSLGLRAAPRPEPTCGSTASPIIEIADAVDAAAIVVGTRGNGWPKSLVIGSTSNALLHHSRCPVVLVPSPERLD